MNSFHSIFQKFSHNSTVKFTPQICLSFFLIIVVFAGCTNSEDFANPLDADNLRTAGAPDGLKLFPGDKQIRVTWVDSGQDGIQAYKIYRRSTSNSDEPFTLIATVNAPTNEYNDTNNIENDRLDAQGRVLAYEYRISYIDINGVETPDPANPPDTTEEPFRYWQTATVTPSIAPPAPVVTLGEPRDLAVGLFWENYEFPDDFSTFRIYSARDDGDSEQLVFSQVAELERERNYYFDISFRQDGIKKIYRVAAVDIFGVEGITTIAGTSPNLPPSPPENVRVSYLARSLLNSKYDAIITWDENKELDLAGYQIYTKDAEGNLFPRGTANRFETTITFTGEDPLIIDQEPVVRTYFITAYDNTPGLDGKRDHSELVEAQ